MKTVAKGSAIFCALLLMFAVSAVAQNNFGTLRGTISDPTGLVITGAEVTATNAANGSQYKSVTNGRGAYAILELPLGDYTLLVRKEGFETATQSGVTMNSGDDKTIDISLKVGSAAEHVEVTSAPPELETTSGAFSQSENANTLIQLPLSVAGAPRGINGYLTALPGFQQSPGFANQMDGSLGLLSELYIDGTPDLEASAAHGLIRDSPSPEAVEEMKVGTTPMADSGNTGGVAISFVTKSGTNALHGAAYIYQHTTALDAAAEFANKASRDQQGEYGFDLGGPIRIPKVYDGRDKTFFWINYGWYHYKDSSGASFYGVPTDAWKAGNFADQLGAQIGTDDLGRPVLAGQIYNPYTTRALADGTVVRDPFPGNIVPPALFSSIATQYQSFSPEPNLPGDPPNNLFLNVGQGVFPIGSSPQRYWQINLDQNVRNRDHIKIAYWNYWGWPKFTEQLPLIYSTVVSQLNHGNHLHINWTHTFSPRLVHVVSESFDRTILNDLGTAESNNGAMTVGLINPLGPECTPGFGVPNISLSGSGASCNEEEADTNYGFNDNWTFSYGHHLTKWGFNFARFAENFPGTYSLGAAFRGPQTAIPNQPLCPNCLNTTGVAYASFLMGAIQSANTQGYLFSSPREIQYGFYVADEYRVTPKVTVTYGLRYDAQPMPIQRLGRTSGLSFTLPNAAAGGLPGALVFGGHGSGTLNTNQMAPSEYWTTNFAPKASVAYQFMPKWVVRGAYSMNYAPPGQNEAGFQAANQQGYFPNFSTVTLDGYTPAYFLDNGFPFPPGVPLYNDFNPDLYNGSSTAYYGKTSDHAPRIQDVHADIQHEFPGRIVVSMNYIGTFAHGILSGNMQPVNQLNYATYGSLGNLLTDDINSAAARGANIPIPYAGFTGSVAQALRPYPQYLDIENQMAILGFQTYNSGLVQASKSFSNGFSFLFGYTFAKQLTNTNSTPQNGDNLAAEKAISANEMAQQTSLNYTYALPFGRGQHFNIDNRTLDAVAGGWSVAGIHTYQSGGAIFPGTNQTLPTVDSSLRPDVVPGTPVRTNISCAHFSPFNGDLYLNPAHFVDPGPFTFGNARDTLDGVYGCPYLNESISAFKAFSFTEGIKLKIGADFFNAFNRHEWSNPNANIDSGAYGVITGQANSPRSIQANARLTF